MEQKNHWLDRWPDSVAIAKGDWIIRYHSNAIEYASECDDYEKSLYIFPDGRVYAETRDQGEAKVSIGDGRIESQRAKSLAERLLDAMRDVSLEETFVEDDSTTYDVIVNYKGQIKRVGWRELSDSIQKPETMPPTQLRDLATELYQIHSGIPHEKVDFTKKINELWEHNPGQKGEK